MSMQDDLEFQLGFCLLVSSSGGVLQLVCPLVLIVYWSPGHLHQVPQG
jgi:hypothetical protein